MSLSMFTMLSSSQVAWSGTNIRTAINPKDECVFPNQMTGLIKGRFSTIKLQLLQSRKQSLVRDKMHKINGGPKAGSFIMHRVRIA